MQIGAVVQTHVAPFQVTVSFWEVPWSVGKPRNSKLWLNPPESEYMSLVAMNCSGCFICLKICIPLVLSSLLFIMIVTLPYTLQEIWFSMSVRSISEAIATWFDEVDAHFQLGPDFIHFHQGSPTWSLWQYRSHA